VLDLAGRVAVVTGAASGIGYGLATRFGAEGMRVVLADVEQGALDEAAARLSADGVEVEPVPTDVTDAAQVEALAEAAFQRFGAVHVVCNNAGVVTLKRMWEQTLDDWRWVLGVDLWGVIHGVHSFVPRLLEQDEPAHIVNTASIAGLLPNPRIGPYNVAKFGVVALSETLRMELLDADAPIGVSVLCPGIVPTRIAESGRNRPGRSQRASADSDRLDIPTQTDLPPTALTPDQVAGRVVDAIRADRFWIVTHEQFADDITRRAAGILAGADPVAPPVL
jgi:NAD(P)-dependent dehydrogenase (short-subunit alcohol dehydrogenase family)